MSDADTSASKKEIGRVSDATTVHGPSLVEVMADPELI